MGRRGARRGRAARPRLIGGTKGSHLVVEPFPGAPREAVYAEAVGDGRPYFVVPWNGLYLIGTTDTRYEGDLDDVVATDEEIAYLIEETNRLIPGAALTADQVLYTYAGVRPLPAPGAAQGARRGLDHAQPRDPRPRRQRRAGGRADRGPAVDRRRQDHDLPAPRGGDGRRRRQEARAQGRQVPHAPAAAAGRDRLPVRGLPRALPRRRAGCRSRRPTACCASTARARPRRSTSPTARRRCASRSTRTAARSAPRSSSRCAPSWPRRSPTSCSAARSSATARMPASARSTPPPSSAVRHAGWTDERAAREVAAFRAAGARRRCVRAPPLHDGRRPTAARRRPRGRCRRRRRPRALRRRSRRLSATRAGMVRPRMHRRARTAMVGPDACRLRTDRQPSFACMIDGAVLLDARRRSRRARPRRRVASGPLPSLEDVALARRSARG